MNSSGTTIGVIPKHQPEVGCTEAIPGQSLTESGGRENSPLIEVSESEGMFHVHADFSRLPELDRESETAVEFARQGVKITCGSVQRYIPVLSDGEIERATVTNAGGIVHIAVPTAGLGQRWRSIIMW